MKRAHFATPEYTAEYVEQVKQAGAAALARIADGVQEHNDRKAAALAVLGQAHHAYKSSPTRATFRTCLDAIKVCQEVGATTQEIKRAQQG